VTVTQPSVGEVLEVASIPVVMPTVDISDGAVDFAHWGLVDAGSVNRKSGTPTIGDLTPLNAAFVRYLHDSDTRQRIAWTGGDPTATEAGTRSGIYSNGVGAGLRLTVPVSAVSQELRLYCARGNASANVVATISDGPTKQIALPFAADATDAAVAIQFFGENTKTLTVDIVKTSEGGSVAVRAAKLTGSLSLEWSDPLSGAVYEPLTSTLTLSGFAGTASIVATNLPGSSSFTDNGDNTATFSMVPAVADASASPLIFTVTVFDGATALLSTQYSLTVAAATANPPVISLGSTLEFAVGTEKSVTISATGETPIALTVSGLPGSATWLDNGNSTATLTWEPASGDEDESPYPITITATDVDGRRTPLSESITATDAAAPDILTVTPFNVGVDVRSYDLTSGSIDWVHFSLATAGEVNRKSVTPTIGEVTVTGPYIRAATNGTGQVAWSDGTPVSSAASQGYTRLDMSDSSNFAFEVPANTSTRTLIVFCAAQEAANIRLTATMGSDTVTETVNLSTVPCCMFAVQFRKASAGNVAITVGRNGLGRAGLRALKLVEGAV
jgi:hypothetical protein